MEYIFIDVKAKKEGYKPPAFLGSMLRGAFGASLKDVVCVNPSFECEGCFAADNCLYYEIYEKKKRFHDFRFDFDLYPQELAFGLYLFGDAAKKYPYVLSAIHRMIERKGLGAKRERLAVEHIAINGQPIFDGEFKHISVAPKKFRCDEYCPVAKIKLITPLRMKKDGS